MNSKAEVQPPSLCSLLLFLATSAEKESLQRAAGELDVEFKKDPELTKSLRAKGLDDEAWRFGTIGTETVVAVGPSRERGQLVMGAHGRLGSAAKAVRYATATGAQGIIQLGMAFGVARGTQKIGDVLVSTSIIAYDNRDVKPWPKERCLFAFIRDILKGLRVRWPEACGYVNDYTRVRVEPARASLVERCQREKRRGKFAFNIHIGSMLSGAARIHCAAFRDELVMNVPHGNYEIVGGEMEGVGLLSGAVSGEDPIWCVVKGISDFADENRDDDIVKGKEVAPYHAAQFVLCSLKNDAIMLAK